MPGENTRITSVRLRVKDLHATASFYEKIVGLTLRFSDADSVEMGTQNTTFFVLKKSPAGRPGNHATGLYHTAFRVPSRSDLSHWLLHTSQSRMVSLQGASDHGVSEAIYLADPEGNGIEIYHDRPPSSWTKDDQGRIRLITQPLDIRSLLDEAPDTSWTQLPAMSDIGHVHLKVNDLQAAKQFYIDTLGFDIKSVFRDSALFIAGGSYHHHIGLNTWESRNAPRRTPDMFGLTEFRVDTGSNQDLRDIEARLRATEYPYSLSSDGEITVTDPAGITIVLS